MMTPVEPPTSATVLLVGADAGAVEALQPAAAMLQSYGIQTVTVLWTQNEGTAAATENVDAIIVASPDATLPTVLAARTGSPVIRVPTEGEGRRGLALLTDGHADLPAGPPNGVFATMTIGEAGAKNAALFTVSALALEDPRVQAAWGEFRLRQTDAVLRHPPLGLED